MKILGISDTHGLHDELWDVIKSKLSEDDISSIDTIVHSGDISSYGREEEVEDFLSWYHSLPFKNKVFILGNHEVGMENKEDFIRDLIKEKYNSLTFLHGESVTIDGINFFGAPETPYFRGWAYNVTRPKLELYWERIPLLTNVLITHGPPFGVMDSVWSYYDACNIHTGDVELLKMVTNLLKFKQLQVHQFGHIHEWHGVMKIQDNNSLPNTPLDLKFVNASCLKSNYTLEDNPYIIYEIEKRNFHGESKFD